jgi:hypothetical protein
MVTGTGLSASSAERTCLLYKLKEPVYSASNSNTFISYQNCSFWIVPAAARATVTEAAIANCE